MAGEDVEVARRAYAAFNRGDFDGALQHLATDIEWRMSPNFARSTRVFRGHDGVREVFAIFEDTLEGFRAEPADLYDAGEVVVAPVTISGRLRGSDEPVRYDVVQVWSVREGRAYRLDVYEDLSSAWAALGMTPPARSSDSISDSGTGRDSR